MTAGFLLPEEESKRRYNICKECEFFKKFTGQCSRCGCIMRVKTKLNGQICPENKWGNK